MPPCSIINCREKYPSNKTRIALANKSNGITFHGFPSDTKYKNEWIKVLQKNRNDPYWLPLKNSAVCSLHFVEEDLYYTSNGSRRTKKWAIPKKVNLVNSVWCQENEGSQSESLMPETIEAIEPCSIKEEDEEYQVDIEIDSIDPADTERAHIPHTSNCQPGIQTTSCEASSQDVTYYSIYDNPEIYKLRLQVRNYKSRYELQARKIALMKKRIKRLENKNSRLNSSLIRLRTSLDEDLKEKKKEKCVEENMYREEDTIESEIREEPTEKTNQDELIEKKIDQFILYIP